MYGYSGWSWIYKLLYILITTENFFPFFTPLPQSIVEPWTWLNFPPTSIFQIYALTLFWYWSVGCSGMAVLGYQQRGSSEEGREIRSKPGELYPVSTPYLPLQWKSCIRSVRQVEKRRRQEEFFLSHEITFVELSTLYSNEVDTLDKCYSDYHTLTKHLRVEQNDIPTSASLQLSFRAAPAYISSRYHLPCSSSERGMWK